MYYSDEVIDQVRTASDIVDVIGQSVQLKRSGSNYLGLCPFHNEKTPSFSVSRQKQMFYCFGCHKGGNVITFVEEYNNMTFTEALQYLADRAGIRLPERSEGRDEKRRRDERQALLDVNKTAATFYYYMLRSEKGKPGMDYLKGRGLSDETMKSFALGFAPPRAGELYAYLKQKGVKDELLKDSGLMSLDERRGTMYDKFWNRVIFPIMDVNNKVIGFGGRVMGDGKPKYLNSPETKIFDKSRNLYALNVARRSREKYLILCEGYMDVISMHQAGFTNAVASLGTALTQQHCALLKRYTNDVILSYDSDAAGVNAAMRAIPMLRRAGITPKILKLEPYKDPDEFIKALGRDEFKKRLADAQNAMMFEVGITARGYDLNDPDSKTAFFDEVAGMICRFDNPMARQSYTETIAREYMVDEAILKDLVNRKLLLGKTADGRAPRPAGRSKKVVPIRSDFSGAGDTGAGQASSASGAPYDSDVPFPEADYYGQESYDWPEDPASYYGADSQADYYEDSATGELYRAPRTAVRRGREGSIKEQGLSTSRQLLLCEIAQYPSVFPVVKKYVKSSDYGDGLTGQVAELLYRQMEESGQADEAQIMSRFTEPEEQRKIAELFHTLDPAESGTEREKAIRETLMKVCSAAEGTAEGEDPLEAAVKKKQVLNEIRKLRIPLE